MNWQQQHNNSRTDQIAPVLRVSWSHARCWHGDTVEISVRSTFVPDGGVIDLAIYAVGNLLAVDNVANLVINGNSLDHNYVVNWKNKVVPQNVEEFEVKASLQNPAVVSAASAPMRVDLLPPLFSY